VDNGTRTILLVYGGHPGGRTDRLRAAVESGVRDLGEGVTLTVCPALRCGPKELLAAHGLLLGTPEHFGYMSGALKDFFDRTFYPTEGRTAGLPYALFVSAGTDGTDGPTDAAGALVDGDTCRQAWQRGLNPAAYLENNDSYNFFDRLGQLFKTGPTRTNVMDLMCLLVDKRSSHW